MTQPQTRSEEKKYIIETVSQLNDIHHTYHKFYKWLTKTYGNDLYGPWIVNKVKNSDGKMCTLKYRNFDEVELAKRLGGYDVIQKIEKYVKRACPEIRIVHCDDEMYDTSILLLIPHPKHGITVIFIPQMSGVQNQFFLYGGHYLDLLKNLNEMREIYEKEDLEYEDIE